MSKLYDKKHKFINVDSNKPSIRIRIYEKLYRCKKCNLLIKKVKYTNGSRVYNVPYLNGNFEYTSLLPKCDEYKMIAALE